MSEYLGGSLPIYASMKDLEGHVVWANEKHLKKWEPRIDYLLEKEGLLDLLAQPVHAKLKALDGGSGPTDVHLYGEIGREYQTRDAQIVVAARNAAGDRNLFFDEMNKVIRGWYPKLHDVSYPDRGWMEYLVNDNYFSPVTTIKIPHGEVPRMSGSEHAQSCRLRLRGR